MNINQSVIVAKNYNGNMNMPEAPELVNSSSSDEDLHEIERRVT
jgi:hypothetical protein